MTWEDESTHSPELKALLKKVADRMKAVPKNPPAQLAFYRFMMKNGQEMIDRGATDADVDELITTAINNLDMFDDEEEQCPET